MKSKCKDFLQFMESRISQNISAPNISMLGFPFKVGKLPPLQQSVISQAGSLVLRIYKVTIPTCGVELAGLCFLRFHGHDTGLIVCILSMWHS